MKITSVKVRTPACGGHDGVDVWVDSKLSGTILTDIGDGEKLASILRVKAMVAGQEPHWLTKDFNVLYRAASNYLENTSCGRFSDGAELRAQLLRLREAFTDTEEVRAWMRGERE